MRIHRKKIPIIRNLYTLGEEELSVVFKPIISRSGAPREDQLETHITSVASKAGKTLVFLRRNLGKCTSDVKKQAYISLVRPQLEYASAIWDPPNKTR